MEKDKQTAEPVKEKKKRGRKPKVKLTPHSFKIVKGEISVLFV